MVEPQSNGESSQDMESSNVEIVNLEQAGAESNDDSRPQQESSRAEEALDDLLQRASGWTQWLSLQGLVWYSRAREELEDIVAEAQQIRHAPNLNPFSPAAIYSRGREELARIVVEAQQIRASTRSHDEYIPPDGGPVVEATTTIGPTADQPVGAVPGIGSVFSGRLEEGGIRTVQDLALAQPAELARLLGTGEERAEAFVEEAKKLIDQQ